MGSNIIAILLILLAAFLYLYIKQPWRKGYLEIKENGKIMTKRRYVPKKHSVGGNPVHIREENNEHIDNPAKEKDEEAYHSKFDFLFKKQKDEKEE